MRIEYYSPDPLMNISMVIFFIVFLLIAVIFFTAIISLFKKRRYEQYTPYISILVPAYNEEKTIKRCLDAILKSNYDMDKIEIICIDDGSTDKTASIVKKFKEVKLIKGKHEGKSRALNQGLRETKHELIMTIDADTIIHKNFIQESVNPFKDKEVGATNAIALIDKPRKVIEFFQDLEYHYNNLIRESFSEVFGNGIWFFGAAATFRRKAIDEVGGFSQKVLTEDMDISLSIVEKGYKVLTIGTAKYWTRPCHNLKELFEQRTRWFFGGVQCTIKHIGLFKNHTFAIKYLFFSQVFWISFSFLIIPIVIYQVNFWMPPGPEIAGYLFRWFSLSGPAYVLYKMPEWGLSFINIFGVSAGILTFFSQTIATIRFKVKGIIRTSLAMFFYFPYTIVLNTIMIGAVIKYGFSKKRFFKD